MRPGPIARWYQHVADDNLNDIESLLAENAVFQSPAVHAPQQGRALAAKYLRAAMIIFKDPTFRYVGEWFGERSAVLEFELTIDNIYMNGVDIIRWNANDQVDQFKVMIRPLKGLNAVIPLMGQQLQVLK